MGVRKQELLFKFNDKYYKVSVTNLSYNRYDKQYYFLDMWEDPKVKWEEVEIVLPVKGLIETIWDTSSKLTDANGHKLLQKDYKNLEHDVSLLELQQIYARLIQKNISTECIKITITI